MHHVLAQIWKHLPVRDVVNVLQVSSSWNSAILVDLGAMERYIIAKESYDENPNSQESRRQGPLYRRTKISPRKALLEISKNELLSPVKKSPSKVSQRRSPRLNNTANELKPIIVSPSKFRHRLFTEEAQRLAPDEKLQPCPRCTMPSRVNPNEGKAQCSRRSCQYEFCILCNCTFHEEKPCRITRGCKMKSILTVNSNPTSPSSSTTSSSSSGNYSKARVSSKVSKRRLKRL